MRPTISIACAPAAGGRCRSTRKASPRQLLSPPGAALTGLLVTVEPGGGTAEAYAHAGHEFGFVLSGEVELTVDGHDIRAEGRRQLRLQEHAAARLPQSGRRALPDPLGEHHQAVRGSRWRLMPLVRLEAVSQDLSRRHRRARRRRPRHRARRIPDACSGRPAAARPRACASLPASRARRAARCCSMAATSRRSGPSTGRSTPSSRTTRCFRI